MNHLIIVAGGSGQRMGGILPKQFTLLAEKPILLRTLEAFHNAGIDEIIVVLPQDHISTWKQIIENGGVDIPHKICAGGSERTFSVINGLELLPDEGVVGVHDGVRPLLSKEMIDRCFSEAAKNESAVPIMPIKASLRRKTDHGNEAVDRNDFFEVQTPQCFSMSKLKAAYEQVGSKTSSDDATVFELAGNKIHLVDGEESNIKITTPNDLKIAEAILASE